MASTILAILLAIIIFLQVIFLIWTLFMLWGMVQEWRKTRDGLAVALLSLFAALALERLWWVETFSVFSPTFPVTITRLFNLGGLTCILTIIDITALVVLWRLYRDQ